jgi:hypothetical protein
VDSQPLTLRLALAPVGIVRRASLAVLSFCRRYLSETAAALVMTGLCIAGPQAVSRLLLAVVDTVYDALVEGVPLARRFLAAHDRSAHVFAGLASATLAFAVAYLAGAGRRRARHMATLLWVCWGLYLSATHLAALVTLGLLAAVTSVGLFVGRPTTSGAAVPQSGGMRAKTSTPTHIKPAFVPVDSFVIFNCTVVLFALWAWRKVNVRR